MCSFGSQGGSKSLTVLFLDGRPQTFDIEGSTKGSALLEIVFQYLQITDTQLFGLQYIKNRQKHTPEKNPEQLVWLKDDKAIPKNVGTGDNPLLFGVKFYIPDPMGLKNKHSLHQFFLQVARDMAVGKMQLLPSNACLLASYVVQAKIGDHHSIHSDTKYIADLNLLPNITTSMQHHIKKLHENNRGQLPSEAEYNFLENAWQTDMYGVQTYPVTVKNPERENQSIGVAFEGLAVYENEMKTNLYRWSTIKKCTFMDRTFHVSFLNDHSQNGSVLKFKMGSVEVAKALLETVVMVHAFHEKYMNYVRTLLSSPQPE